MTPDLSDGKYPYKDLTYKLIGALFKVHNFLGNSLSEKYYQRALSCEFKDLKLKFKQEIPVELKYGNESIGEHRLDFIIEDKVILEIKTLPQITNKSLTQLLAYLKSTGLRVGILANFRTERLSYRRIINPLIR